MLFVRKIWSEGEKDIEKVAERIIDQTLVMGSTDNISAIVP